MVREVKDVANSYDYLTKAHPPTATVTREVGDLVFDEDAGVYRKKD